MTSGSSSTSSRMRVCSSALAPFATSVTKKIARKPRPKSSAASPSSRSARSFVHRRRKPSATRSRLRGGSSGFTALGSLILFPVLAHGAERGDVQRERHEEEHETERERRERLRAVECLVAD